MPKSAENRAEQYRYTQNRELSWLRFNQRVLEEAADESNPLLERLKFVAIFANNLDEFFMVRVGSLFDLAAVSPEAVDNKTGMTPIQQLHCIYQTVPGLIEQKKAIYAGVLSALHEAGVEDVTYQMLSSREEKYIERYFKTNILPILSPIIIGSHHPVPHLVSKRLYVTALLQDKKGKGAIGILPVPQSVPAYVKLPETELRFIRTEEILLHRAPALFGAYEVLETCLITVTRNADISFDEEKFEDNEEDFRKQVLKLLKKRGRLAVVRLELNQEVSDPFFTCLTKLVQVDSEQCFVDSCPLQMGYIFPLAGALSHGKAKRLSYPPYPSRWPEDLEREKEIIPQIQRQDRLLFYPFDSVEPFLRLLSEAAERPDVLSIKITIYRLASSSKIAHILCRAAENGKEVLVLMELRARFDEANNVAWSELLEEAGCQVVYGMEGFKCHSKICLITLRDKGKMRYITQIGTGNYNEKTNAMYTDLSLMTASEPIGQDAVRFFRNLLVNDLAGQYQELLVSPYGIRDQLCALIDQEMEKGADGYICIKVNSVTERGMIDKLRAASQAGVQVELIVRGICCLLPGVAGETEHIQVTSIVGRFLEHARIYCFGKGADAKMYLSSADLMTRNLKRRVEIACPVHDREIREQLQWMLTCQLRDNVKASFLCSDGTYHRKEHTLSTACNSQEQFMTESFHRPVEPEPEPVGFWQRMREHWKHG